MGEMITFAANGTTCPGYLAKASRNEARGLVVIQEWWGMTRHIRALTDRIAGIGYHALAPDLYHGVVTTGPDEAGKLLMALNTESAAADTRGAIEYLREMTGHGVGIVGFCMGGALGLYAACDNPESVIACINFYGSHPNIQPRLEALNAPLLGFFGERDEMVTRGTVATLARQLDDARKDHDFITYPDADHAFFNNDRPEMYNATAAADSWRKMRAFIDEHLGT